jgi:hypothetical protein
MGVECLGYCLVTIKYSLSWPVTSIGLRWEALFQVDWLTTRMSRRVMGGQTGKIQVEDMGD